MKFLADHMLGKLARYLRFLGYDTYYPDGKMSDDAIIEIARREGRIILTRDRDLARRANGVYVESDDFREQLRFVIGKFNLNGENMLSRCSVCNELLIAVSKEEIRDLVPEYVYLHHDEFYRCPRCGRIYWYGTHTERIERSLRSLLGEENED